MEDVRDKGYNYIIKDCLTSLLNKAYLVFILINKRV
jgi:hypothetical protein